MVAGHQREIAVGVTIVALMGVLAVMAPGYFSMENIVDLFLTNTPVMIVALGMTLIILTGHIDISVGSVFAIAGIVSGLCARVGMPGVVGALAACVAGMACGALNGSLVGYARVPSIVVTLATMVTLRDGLRWQTQGAWVGGLPGGFQWFGLTQGGYFGLVLGLVVGMIAGTTAGLRYLHAGRAVYATGSNEAAARLVGIDTRLVTFTVFALTGALTGFAGALNAVRFNQIPSNSGLGLELKVIAAVAVGGAAVTGGSGTIAGTVLGVVLLGSIGTALVFLNVNPYWEKAIQGGIILGAIALTTLRAGRRRQASAVHAIAR